MRNKYIQVAHILSEKHGEKGLELYKIDKNVGKILELLRIEKKKLTRYSYIRTTDCASKGKIAHKGKSERGEKEKSHCSKKAKGKRL